MERNGLTEEQRARAERNRQAALAKKRKRGQPAPPAASGAAEAAEPAEAPKMTREEYASICRMFGTQPSQASQPSQRDDGDAWPTSCVDVTDEPPRAEAPPRDDDRGAAPARDDRGAEPAR